MRYNIQLQLDANRNPQALPEGGALKHVLAIDFGGTKTSIALVDDQGNIREKQKFSAAPTFRASINQIAGYARAEIVAAGVIIPGIYDRASGLAWAPNLWGNDYQPLRAELEECLPTTLAIASDRTGSVLAEQWLGCARGLQNVVFVAVGTGIGVGIVVDGRPIEGAGGIAGAAGWMIVGTPWKAEYAACGAWETLAAGPAMARRAGMRDAESAAGAARAGDTKALAAVHETADYLAMGIANLIAVLNPEMVVLGGGCLEAGDLMLDRIRTNALCWTQPIAARTVRIEKTALGVDAGLLGAARLAWLSIQRT